MGRQRELYPTPSDDNVGMVILFFSDMTNLVGEIEAFEICFELVFLLDPIIEELPTGQAFERQFSVINGHGQNALTRTTVSDC